MFEAYVNDRPATFMADTGATLVVLTYEDAGGSASRRKASTSRLASQRPGVSSVAPVTLDRVRVDDITVRDVEALVAERARSPPIFSA